MMPHDERELHAESASMHQNGPTGRACLSIHIAARKLRTGMTDTQASARCRHAMQSDKRPPFNGELKGDG
jgi:hypothetical protein